MTNEIKYYRSKKQIFSPTYFFHYKKDNKYYIFLEYINGITLFQYKEEFLHD